MQSIHYFAGANTARGFVSRFHNIVPEENRRRMVYLKGGPGVGKSTLMKRVAEAAQEKGQEVVCFHCSSDPDSLDGVALPGTGVGLMDATAPHVYDPSIPGARDVLISLGDYLDEKALMPHLGEIAAIQRDIAARFRRCWRYLAAAGEVLHSAETAAEDEGKVEQLADEWARTLPLRGGTGSVTELFASAFTPKGLLQITDFSHMERRVTLEVPFGAHATELMRRIARKAAGRGLDVVLLLDPLTPEEVAHVLIPAHGVAFCTAARRTDQGEWLDADAVFRLREGSERELSFDRNACELLCQRASEQLASAHALHDELERFYIKNMDYEGWGRALARVLAWTQLA